MDLKMRTMASGSRWSCEKLPLPKGKGEKKLAGREIVFIQTNNMTLRRFYAPPAAFAVDEKSLTLSAEETRHARDVLRLQSGDEIFVFDGAGREFQCSVQTISRTEAEVSVIAEVDPARPESPLDLTLAIALLKGEKFDLVIQKATELGVKRILPLETERADVRLGDNNDANKRVARW